MENASNALIIAASVLVGVMIISIGVVLFMSFGGTGSNIMEQINEAQINEFNKQFTKYIGNSEGVNSINAIKLTAHDVVTLINIAKENNTKYEFTQVDNYNDNSLYVRIDIKKSNNTKIYDNAEKIEKEEINTFLAEGYYKNSNEIITKYYKIDSVNYNSINRVNYVIIKEY